mgnify:CR=1 FL=1
MRHVISLLFPGHPEAMTRFKCRFASPVLPDVRLRTIVWKTAEGEAKDNTLSRVQRAYVDAGAVQCGFCTPGLVMTSTAFVEKHKGRAVTREDIRRGHAGNLCRCTGYDAIVAAVESCLNDTVPQNACACLRKPEGPCPHHK